MAKAKSENDIHSNVIDPFSAVFDSVLQNLTITDWLTQENHRQIQKTLQNKIGTFHQEVIGKTAGGESLQTGKIVDVKFSGKKIIAEIKNKFNTTKGNHKKEIYDDFAAILAMPEYEDYTGYYVEIIPKRPVRYNKPFTPPDNVTNKQRPENQRIRVIDGYSFYDLVTGIAGSLEMLYQAIPYVVGDIMKLDSSKVDKIVKDHNYKFLFEKAYAGSNSE